MPEDSDVLQIMEVALTAEIFNQNTDLDINDLPPACRDIFSIVNAADMKRPVFVSDGLIKRTLGITDAHLKVSSNPFVSYEEFGQRLHITALEPAARWFLKQGGGPIVERNPALAYYFEKIDSTGISYDAVRAKNPPYEDTKAYLDARISKLVGEDEKLRGALDLVIVLAPEEVEQRMDDLVCTEGQTAILTKIICRARYVPFHAHARPRGPSLYDNLPISWRDVKEYRPHFRSRQETFTGYPLY